MRATTLLLCTAFAASAAERVLVDEVVAVVDTHSITLSELAAETRLKLAFDHGPEAAALTPDRALLAAALRRTIEERVVLAEIERLRLFDLDRSEVDTLVARLRSRFRDIAAYRTFIRSLDLNEDEIGMILSRELRVGRYLDNRLKLAAQARDGEVDEAAKGARLSASERDALRTRLSAQKYQRLLQELLADLRRRATVRVLDPLDPSPATAEAR